jgi:hypothetical protein
MAFTHGMTRPLVGFLAVAAMIAAYAGATIYFDRVYVDPRPPGRKVRLLPPPFEVNGEYAVKYGVKVDPGAVVFEDKDELDELTGSSGEYRGPGRFQILPNGITFSSTDGTNPNEQRHRYWVVTK